MKKIKSSIHPSNLLLALVFFVRTLAAVEPNLYSGWGRLAMVVRWNEKNKHYLHLRISPSIDSRKFKKVRKKVSFGYPFSDFRRNPNLTQYLNT